MPNTCKQPVRLLAFDIGMQKMQKYNHICNDNVLQMYG